MGHHTLFVCLFVVCQTLILPEGKAAHYRNRDFLQRHIILTIQQKDKQLFLNGVKKGNGRFEKEEEKCPRLTEDRFVPLRSSERWK